jgi:4-amino-4-deoxy-L-arabinose transferase-like glycosyltransferase
LLLLVIMLAAVLRFWQLGQLPPGLYRDEAYNGLDALSILDGRHALFFPANNGREPAYIYLTALFVALFGRSALAVRLSAAVIGTLTTWLTYQLVKAWFDHQVGLLAAFVWAATLWPVHLSRIGLRPILLAPAMAATFWLGTMAFKQQKRWLWLLAGLVYGIGFYTYLAFRFTPMLLLAIALYLIWRGRAKALWPGVLWFGLGTAVTLFPLLLLILEQPAVFIGRTGQVSILNTAVNDGDLWGTVWQHIGRALGMFFWRGDTILRHNPAGRPVFDGFMALPFLVGLVWSIKNWRRPEAMVGLLWTAVMLGPTALAADTPHFLRASGVLPGVLIFPAIGLARMWKWELIAGWMRKTAVFILTIGSLMLTVSDYVDYGQSPDTSYLFEQAARNLAEQANEDVLGIDSFIDDRFWSGWPSIPFLVTNPNVYRFWPGTGLPPLTRISQLYIWPYAERDFIPTALPTKALIWTKSGPLARGDLEPEPYPLYAYYHITPNLPDWPIQAQFGDKLALRRPPPPNTPISLSNPPTVQVDLIWSADSPPSSSSAVFVHVVGPQGTIAQTDAPPGNGHWPANWWRPGLLLHDRRVISLPEPFDPARYTILVGIYDIVTGDRLPVTDAFGQVVGDSWELKNDD